MSAILSIVFNVVIDNAILSLYPIVSAGLGIFALVLGK